VNDFFTLHIHACFFFFLSENIKYTFFIYISFHFFNGDRRTHTLENVDFSFFVWSKPLKDLYLFVFTLSDVDSYTMHSQVDLLVL
jgi:hypothetical protein